MNVVDIVMIVTLILSVIILFLSVFLAKRRCVISSQDDLIKVATKLRNAWLGSSIVFLIVHYWCVLISILSTLVVLYIGCFENTNLTEIKARIILYSVLSLFATIFPHVVNCLKISKKYREAFIKIEEQLVISNELGKAIIDGENIISSAFED